MIEPAPAVEGDLDSLRTWKDGQHAPRLAVDVVSPTHPYKDYDIAPEKYASMGVEELWVFDPHLAGSKRGAFRIQVWLRAADGAFERVYAGDGPAYAPAVNAWLFAVDEGRRLRIADDEEGTHWWRTAEEAALARVAELEADLRRRGS